MRFLRRPRPASRSIAVFCGAFHPPTVAHVALADAAKSVVDEVVWVMPERFPHKSYEGVALPARLRMVLESTGDAVAVSRESLFFSIAGEMEEALPGRPVQLLIGEDGARRIVEWDYGLDAIGHAEYLESNLKKYPVLSARRQEAWELPDELATYFAWLEVERAMEEISSTEVRKRLACGGDWAALVPEGIRLEVLRHYGPTVK
jgi:nicotinate-nucleotide adenylyltransferase